MKETIYVITVRKTKVGEARTLAEAYKIAEEKHGIITPKKEKGYYASKKY